MKLSNLNKIGALFIAGSIGVLWVFVFWGPEAASFLEAHKDLANPLSAALGAFLLLPLSVLAGLVLEGLAELTLRPLVGSSLRRRRLAVFFRQCEIWESTVRWQTVFLDLVSSRPFFSSVLEHPGGGVPSRQLASGIFHQNATKDQVDWLLSHYATYYLATSFGLTLILIVALPIKLFLAGCWSLVSLLVATLFLLASLYAVLSLAIDRFLYTYFATFRFAALWLDGQETSSQ